MDSPITELKLRLKNLSVYVLRSAYLKITCSIIHYSPNSYIVVYHALCRSFGYTKADPTYGSNLHQKL